MEKNYKDKVAADIIRQVTSVDHNRKASAIDCHDELAMINAGLRVPLMKNDVTFKVKTQEEKNTLIILKSEVVREPSGADSTGKTEKSVVVKVFVKNTGSHDRNAPREQQRKFFKTTYQESMLESDVSDYIKSFTDKKHIVNKVLINNKELN